MKRSLPSSLPAAHESFLRVTIDVLSADSRIVGVAAAGSFLSNSMDEWSDLDLVIATEPAHHDSVMGDRRRIADALGPVLAAFTGEHVGEPRLLICLYAGAPPLHVDLKFVALPDVAMRVEEPSILWERAGRFSRALEASTAHWPAPNLQWIEDRFWIWVHYAAAKIGRGELFEALDFLSYLRATVLGPLSLVQAGARPSGVRKLERVAPHAVSAMRDTVATLDAADCARALRACVAMYCALRANARGVIETRHAAQSAALDYLADIEACIAAARFQAG